MRTLAVTGDDFGRSRAVNRGIAEAHDRGVLTRASLMVAGYAAEEAVDLARSRPGLAVGLHLVVVDGRAALSHEFLPSITDESGRFRGGPVAAGLRYQFSAASRSELAREVRGQLERFRETGLPLSHVDGHHHMHLHPVLLGMLADLACEFRIPAIRLPSEELRLALDLDGGGAAGKVLWSVIFGWLRSSGEKRLARAGIGFSERVYGLHATGKMTEQYLLGLIPRIRADRVELYCHPARPIPGEPPGGLDDRGERELAALLSRRVKDSLARSGFVLSGTAEPR
ncbi:MAG TPA: hopanoid biosynthesis-associated protein HpnK [Thermoanaerobaculia bacterium]|nr:hopanoid biosynthesis-associated protein HpnK [Thermoanaerobaculia bacterium]